MGQDDRRPPATMSVLEAAKQLGISRNLAYQLVRDGEIPTLRLGRRIIVPRAAFDRWLDSAGLDDGAAEEVPGA